MNTRHLFTPRLPALVPLHALSRPARAAVRRESRRKKRKRKRRKRKKKRKKKKRRKRRRKRKKKKRKRKKKGKLRKRKTKKKRRRRKKRKHKKKRRKNKIGKRRRKMRKRRKRKRRRRRRRRKMRRKKFGRKRFGKRRRKIMKEKKTGPPSSAPYMSHIIINLTGRPKSSSKKGKKIPTFLIPSGPSPPRKDSKTGGGAAASHMLNVVDRLITKVDCLCRECSYLTLDSILIRPPDVEGLNLDLLLYFFHRTFAP